LKRSGINPYCPSRHDDVALLRRSGRKPHGVPSGRRNG
jgi:hypothetical protein